MAIPSSGPISLTTVQTEFGGSNPISLSEYYAGGAYVPAGTTGTYGAVPSSGAISLRNFYGTSKITTYTSNILMVAGGGSGGFAGSNGLGGGGAGGLAQLTGATLTIGSVYTITVGAGGVYAAPSYGGSGSASSIAGTGFIDTSVVGGGGGSFGLPSSGGSGAGGGGSVGGAGASGTSGQGNAGGDGYGFEDEYTGYYRGGGGGGAGAAGAPGYDVYGTGGIGAVSSITGSALYYAGGGGGGGFNQSSMDGGAGGGGRGSEVYSAGTAGAANTGGGGGGASGTGYQGGFGGGSGVVILSIPTARYSGVTTGSPTVTTSGSNTILKFTSSGSYTA